MYRAKFAINTPSKRLAKSDGSESPPYKALYEMIYTN
jgi:hypothetical protein